MISDLALGALVALLVVMAVALLLVVVAVVWLWQKLAPFRKLTLERVTPNLTDADGKPLPDEVHFFGSVREQ